MVFGMDGDIVLIYYGGYVVGVEFCYVKGC